MGKVSVLILFALGAQVNAKVNAEDQLADILRERASNQIGYLPADLDQVTFEKGKGGGGGGARAPTGRREFGGTNQLMAGEGKACRETNEAPSYWGGRRARGGPGKLRGTFTPIAQVDRTPKRIFGGTNKLMAGEGKACQEDTPAVPSYWGGQAGTKGWKLGKKPLQVRAVPVATPVNGPVPLAPSLGGAKPFVGARPFVLTERIAELGLGNIAFFVAAMSMISFALILSRRGSAASQ